MDAEASTKSTKAELSCALNEEPEEESSSVKDPKEEIDLRSPPGAKDWALLVYMLICVSVIQRRALWNDIAEIDCAWNDRLLKQFQPLDISSKGK